jgi:anaerobic selenocysteine-containing dehydrogenase
MDSTVKTICPYCGVGCGLNVIVRDDTIVQVKGDADHPANFGSLCTKGATIDQIVRSPNRLTQALWRQKRSDGFSPISLDGALARIAGKFKSVIQEHGRNSVAFYISGQISTESQYVFNKLAKGAIGTNNIDANSRLCMSSAVSAYKLALGADGPPTCYDDIEKSDSFLILGANMAECHPVLWQRVKRRATKSRGKIIVVDPRRTPTAEGAHLHLPIRPGTDVPLLNAMLHIMILQGWINEQFIRTHTDNWNLVKECVEAWSPTAAAKVCGIDERLIHRAAFWFGASAEALSLWAMGANQSTQGVEKNLAIINLHLATGKIGRPGSGPFSLTGQPNAMGGREVGYMCGLLPGHREVTNPEHRKQIAQIWGVPPRRIQSKPGLDAVRMFQALESGEVKILWIVGCNPLATMPEADRIRRALDRAELVVVQDCFHPTETSRLADVLLPAAMNLEIDGTMTNSERRISLMQRCVTPPGDARPDWEIGCRFAEMMGYEEQFSFSSASDIFEEHKRCCSDDHSLKLDGMSYRRLKRQPLQWPCPDYRSPGFARRYRRKIFATPSGNAHFHPTPYQSPADEVTESYPFILNTGRLAHQWHTRTKTGLVQKLNKLNPGPFIAAHPFDAERLNLKEGDPVRASSVRGSVTSNLKIDDSLLPGTLFMSFHWGQSAGEFGCVNTTTNSAADPRSHQPELKFSAVRLERVVALT